MSGDKFEEFQIVLVILAIKLCWKVHWLTKMECDQIKFIFQQSLLQSKYVFHWCCSVRIPLVKSQPQQICVQSTTVYLKKN